MSSYKYAAMTVLMLFLSSMLVNPLHSMEGLDEDSVVERAMRLFEAGKLHEAKKIVDGKYDSTDVYLSLLSGMIYAELDQCKKAKSKMSYVEGYYDEKYWGMENKEKEKLKDIYTNMKRVSIKCNQELSLWGEQIEDIKIYRTLSSEEEKPDITALLADAYRALSEQSVMRAIDEYETLLRISYENEETGRKFKNDALFRLSELYARKGKLEKAEHYLLRLLKESHGNKKWKKKIMDSESHDVLMEREKIRKEIKVK